MKLKKILGVTLLSSVVLVPLLPTTANAEKVVNSVKDTPTEVTITDVDDETDPLKPEDPQQTNLTLDTVPTKYDFSTTLSNKTYTVQTPDNGLQNQAVNVFNDRSSRVWSVKATVDNNEIASETGTKFPVVGFKINDVELVATGADGIIAKSAATPTAANNTGNISTAITSAKIDFTDLSNVLKAGDKLSGKITYQLYNTIDAQ